MKTKHTYWSFAAVCAVVCAALVLCACSDNVAFDIRTGDAGVEGDTGAGCGEGDPVSLAVTSYTAPKLRVAPPTAAIYDAAKAALFINAAANRVAIGPEAILTTLTHAEQTWSLPTTKFELRGRRTYCDESCDVLLGQVRMRWGDVDIVNIGGSVEPSPTLHVDLYCAADRANILAEVQSDRFAQREKTAMRSLHAQCPEWGNPGRCVSITAGRRWAHAVAYLRSCAAVMDTYDAEDDDGDGLANACDCEEPEGDDEKCLTQEGVGEPWWPGDNTCVDGDRDLTCERSDEWEDWGEYVVDEIFDGPLSEGGDAVDDLPDERPYRLRTPDAECPGEAVCNQAAAMRRGRDYEQWLCRRQQRRNPGTLCNNGRGSAGAPAYRANAVRWELSPQLRHRRAQVVNRPAGQLRFPDYTIPPHPRNRWQRVFGEAKCFNPFVEWNDSAGWQWLRVVAFSTQLYSYLGKVIEGRARDPKTAVTYHFCDALPRWVAHEMVAAIGYTSGSGFSFHARDTPPGANWIMAPACYTDMFGILLAEHPELFWCFLPGTVAPEGFDPADSCVGAFYDLCTGSE